MIAVLSKLPKYILCPWLEGQDEGSADIIVTLPSGVTLSQDVSPDEVTGEVKYGYDFTEEDVTFLTNMGATFLS
jgi:hypothetical protein